MPSEIHDFKSGFQISPTHRATGYIITSAVPKFSNALARSVRLLPSFDPAPFSETFSTVRLISRFLGGYKTSSFVKWLDTTPNI